MSVSVLRVTGSEGQAQPHFPTTVDNLNNSLLVHRWAAFVINDVATRPANVGQEALWVGHLNSPVVAVDPIPISDMDLAGET